MCVCVCLSVCVCATNWILKTNTKTHKQPYTKKYQFPQIPTHAKNITNDPKTAADLEENAV